MVAGVAATLVEVAGAAEVVGGAEGVPEGVPAGELPPGVSPNWAIWS